MNPEDFLRQILKNAGKAREHAEKTGQKEEDILFSAGTDDPKISSIQELNASGDAMPFLCVPIKIMPQSPIPNCHQMVCDGCGQTVWMSPGTKEVFDKINQKLIICADCAEKTVLKQKP